MLDLPIYKVTMSSNIQVVKLSEYWYMVKAMQARMFKCLRYIIARPFSDEPRCKFYYPRNMMKSFSVILIDRLFSS